MARVLLGVWVLLAYAAWAVVPFAVAGIRWTSGWVHAVVLVAGLAGHQLYVRLRAPGLREARRAVGAGTPAWDVVWNLLFWPVMGAIAVVGAVDFRTRGSTLPVWTWAAGAVVLASGLAVSARAMAVNRFFEGTARIQRDRDQTVVDTGPYRVVRHPGYLGLSLWAIATPLLLRSTLAFAAAGFAVAWIAGRTILEDRMLRRGLPGYADYARGVRWRLVPGIF